MVFIVLLYIVPSVTALSLGMLNFLLIPFSASKILKLTWNWLKFQMEAFDFDLACLKFRWKCLKLTWNIRNLAGGA